MNKMKTNHEEISERIEKKFAKNLDNLYFYAEQIHTLIIKLHISTKDHKELKQELFDLMLKINRAAMKGEDELLLKEKKFIEYEIKKNES